MFSSKQQAAYTDDHGSNAPEVVHQHTPFIEQRDSILPEAVIRSEKTQPTYGVQPDRAYPPSYEKIDDEAYLHRRKRRKLMIWIVAIVVILLVVVGAVVGGVVGAMGSKKDSSSPPAASPTSSLTAIASTGLALTTVDSGDSRFAYEQISNGSIIEVPYVSSRWSSANATIVTTKARSGSPLAAAAYTLGNTDYRILVFLDANGQVLVTNSTGNGKWTTPVSALTNDTASVTSPALTLCVDTKSLNGIRLYYASASQNERLQELGYDFSLKQPYWQVWHTFTRPNTKSGAACTISNGVNHLYYRNANNIEQLIWSYAASGTQQWAVGQASPDHYPAELTTDVAVTSDGDGRDYIFYRTQNGTFARAQAYGTASLFGPYDFLPNVTAGSKFAAAHLGNGSGGDTLLLSQFNSDLQVSWTETSLSNAVANGTIG